MLLPRAMTPAGQDVFTHGAAAVSARGYRRMTNEKRLEELHEQAWKDGVVADRGVDVAGGPIPRKAGYYGQPVVKPPLWIWEVPVYFFIGGFGGMSAVIALAALAFHHTDVALTAMSLAVFAAVVSPILLIVD